MSPENRPQLQAHPEPSGEVASEMSFTAALKRAVDDLFTYQAIADRLHDRQGDDQMAALLDTWKQGLTHHLQDAAQDMVRHVAATIDLIQFSASAPLTETERQEWWQIAAWHTPFTIASVCREDLRGILIAEDIATFSDDDMARIADRMSRAFQESGGYWESLDTIARSVLAKKQAGPNEATLDRDESSDQSEDLPGK